MRGSCSSEFAQTFKIRLDLSKISSLQAGPGRVIDKYNAKVFGVRFEKKEDVVRLQDTGIAKFTALCSRALLM